MRPRRLVLDGFLAYRQRVEVDFTEADLFVLSGPTGAGKSSVIDGMIFALYGTIPRLDDRRSVAPVISARADLTKVSFEFSVGDETYIAARLVERRNAGATTTEATLERVEGEVLARGADEVTSRVIELLGLTYEQFTKAVVLPQGAFADFLTDKPSERQALLRALLDIGLFERVMQLANARARTAEGRAQAMEESLAKLDVPAPEQVEEARVRLAAIVEARQELPSRVEAMAKLGSELESAKAAHEETSLTLARLGSIAAPKDLATIEKDRADAFARIEALAGSLTDLAARRDEIDLALTGQPALTQLESWKAGMERLDQLAARRSALDLDGLAAQLEEITSTRQRVYGELEAARIGHAAHAVRQGLVVGEPCPVCEVVVGALPQVGGGPGESIDRLSGELAELESRVGEARDRLKGAEGEAKGIDTQLSEASALLTDAPSAEVVDASIAEVRALLEKRAVLEGELSAAQESCRRGTGQGGRVGDPGVGAPRGPAHRPRPGRYGEAADPWRRSS